MDTNPKRNDSTQGYGGSVSGPSSRETAGLRPGGLLNGRYRIDKELGRGGIGVVYLARDERLHSMPVVIKFLLEDTSQNAWLKKKFFQEAEALSRLNHPGIVRVIDRDQAEDGSPFFVMEFVDGRPLRAVMGADGMDLEHAAHLIRQIGQALNAAHREGVFHRDLKPENIMVQTLNNGDEQVKLIDFGIAKVKNSQSGATTDVSVVAGSLNYMAPEQLLAQLISAATDVYSFGAIAYEMITGKRPFNPDAPNPLASAQQLIRLQQDENPVPPQRLRPSLPEAAQEVLLAALSFDPAKRPQDARVFGDALDAALTGALTGATAASPPPDWQTQVSDPSDGRRQATLRVGTQRPEAPVSVPAATEGEEKARRGSGRWMLVSLVLVAVLAAAVFFGRRFLMPAEATKTTPAAASPAPQAAAEPARQLTYSITVQKDPKRYPGSKPFQLPGEVIFSAGDRVRFSFASDQPGHLYILNESPPLAGAPSNFNVLFPSPTSNNGGARLNASQSVQIPERGDGFIFDEEEGTEKLWLVWSAEPVPALDALQKWANPTDRGEVKDASQVDALRQFLSQSPAEKPEVVRDNEQKRTTVKSKGNLLIKSINLEHH